MATYTAAQLQSYTSVPSVASWEDAKILIYQTMAESILTSLDLDTGVTGYTDAYNSAVILLFDWLALNPAGARSIGKGKVRYTFDDLPVTVRVMLQRAMDGESGTLVPAVLERRDIGRR